MLIEQPKREKVKDQLTEPVYEKVKKDSSPETEKRVLKEIREMDEKKSDPQRPREETEACS